jgi:hypothetical protein
MDALDRIKINESKALRKESRRLRKNYLERMRKLKIKFARMYHYKT